MVKRRYVMLLFVMMLVLTLTACNTNEQKLSIKLPSDESTLTVEPTTLKFYFGGDKKAASDEVWDEIGQYVRSKGLNVKFDVQYVPFNEYTNKLLTMSAAGDRWDMNFDAEWLAFKQMAAKGAYLDLSLLLPQYAPALYKKYEETGNLQSATLHDQIVGLPWNIKMNLRKFAGWRLDYVEKAGIEIADNEIQTIEDIDRLLRELKEAFPTERITRTSPLSIYHIRDEWFDINFYNLGFYINDPNLTIQAMEQQPFFLEAGLMANSWSDDRILSKDVIISLEDGAMEWRNGKILFTVTSHEWVEADPGFSSPNYKQLTSLLYPDKKFYNRSQLANVIAINKYSLNPELVLQFLDMLETDQVLYDLVQYGIEGKTYELVDDMAVYPAGMKTVTSNYMEWGGQWAFWNTDFLRPSDTYSAGFWERETKFASEPMNIDTPIDGLLLSETNIRKELLEREKLIQQYARPIEFGVVANVEEEVAKYIELQKSNNVDLIIKEVQSQVDQYIANKRGLE